VTLAIVDINDHDPVFPSSSPRVIEVVESAQVGTRFALPAATDADSARYGVHRYALREAEATGEEMPFELAADATRGGGGGPADVRLVLVGALDRERRAEYRLTLVAYDGGEPARSAAQQVRVVVVDVNDNRPTFAHAHYDAVVPENVPTGSIVVRVRATDPDRGDHAAVRYRLSDAAAAADFHDLFAVDDVTGDVIDGEQVVKVGGGGGVAEPVAHGGVVAAVRVGGAHAHHDASGRHVLRHDGVVVRVRERRPVVVDVDDDNAHLLRGRARRLAAVVRHQRQPVLGAPLAVQRADQHQPDVRRAAAAAPRRVRRQLERHLLARRLRFTQGVPVDAVARRVGVGGGGEREPRADLRRLDHLDDARRARRKHRVVVVDVDDRQSHLHTHTHGQYRR